MNEDYKHISMTSPPNREEMLGIKFRIFQTYSYIDEKIVYLAQEYVSCFFGLWHTWTDMQDERFFLNIPDATKFVQVEIGKRRKMNAPEPVKETVLEFDENGIEIK